MDEISLPYLAWPQGRGGVFYPTYRRDDLLRALKTPDGERLKGKSEIKKDVRVIAAWLPIHQEFEKDKADEENRAGKHKAPFVYAGSIAHAIDGWLDEEVPLLAEGTQEWLKIYSKEIKDQHGHRPANTMPRDAVVKMVNKRAQKTRGAAGNLLATFRSIYLYIEDHPTIFRLPDNWQNPCYGRRKRKRDQRKTVGWAPWEEWMVKRFRNRWPVGRIERVVFEDYLATGQRGSDVASMKRDDYHDGKIAVVQMKTGAKVWIPVMDDFQLVLDPWLDSHPYESFFPNMSGRGGVRGEPLSIERIEGLLRDAIRKAGLPSKCKPHGLRYTFATRAIEMSEVEKRISHQTISAIVGHKTLAMAVKYTQQQRDAKLVTDTVNRGLAAYSAQQDEPPA